MLIVVLAVLGAIVAYAIVTYNGLVSTKKQIKASIQEIGNQLKRQADLIPNLTESVKGYLKHEKDIFDKLTINQSNLRLQCEQEIKGKLIRLRQSYLEMGLQKKQLEGLLSQSLSALMPVFRTIIYLKGRTFSQPRDSIIREIGKNFHLQEEIFFTVLNIKEGSLRLGKSDLENIMQDYFNTLHDLAQKIDKLSVNL